VLFWKPDIVCGGGGVPFGAARLRDAVTPPCFDAVLRGGYLRRSRILRTDFRLPLQLDDSIDIQGCDLG
jgi:hypothetical protein